MASNVHHTIALQGAGVRAEKRSAAGVAVIPGMLLAENGAGRLIIHGAAGGVLPAKLVALESPTAAAGLIPAINTAYDAQDLIYYAVGQPGDVYYMWLAAGQTAVEGQSQLVSDGLGALNVAVVDAATLENSVVGVPIESVDNGAGGAPVRIRVRIV